jgi:hypothetical protein
VVSDDALHIAHALFGGVLQSEIVLPQLPAIDSDRADWFAHVATEPVEVVIDDLGVENVDDRVKVRTGRLAHGFRLEFDDTGTFDITDDGATITWFPGRDARAELARADLLGGVFCVALHLQGLLCLHGSGVAIGSQAVGFLAPKGSGKSTLAMALTMAGAKLVSDDMLAVNPGPPVMVWPAAPTLHLLEDSAHQLHSYATGERNALRGKYRVTNLPPERVAIHRTGLAALYELQPSAFSAAEPAARRVRFVETAATMALLRHPKIGTRVAHAERSATLDRAARVVREVPVFRLEFAHEFSRLPEVVEQVLAWHSAEVPTTGAS